MLINPNTILLIWILCNANRWMPKYLNFYLLLYWGLYFQSSNEDDVYVCIICIHNVLLQEKYYLIHMLMACFNSVFYLYLFFQTNIQAVYYMKWKKETEMPTLTSSSLPFWKYKPQYDTKKKFKSKNIFSSNYSRYIESIVISYLGL